MTAEIKEGLWDAGEVGAYLKVNEETVYRWAQRGRLPFVKIGRLTRFRPDDIRAVADTGLPADEEGAA